MKRVLLIFVVVVAIAVAATAAAVSTAIVVVVVRHVFPKRSIFTWYSMPLALTFFLSFFLPHFFPLLCPFFLTVGAFFFIPFFSHLYHFIALSSCKHQHAIPNGLFMCSFESALTSGGLHVTCSL